MIRFCPDCKATYDDEFRWTICPHETFAANDSQNNFAHHPEAHLKVPLYKIEKDLQKLWDNYQVKPTYMQMKLGNFRKYIAPRDDLQDYAIKFLEEVKDTPDEAIVVITLGHLSLLTDDEGNLLQFNDGEKDDH